MTAPRVSVVLPVYNGERYLAQAVDSILRQTFVDFEVIALDDGSTDGSGDILDQFASTDPRVRVFHQPNHGLITTLNRGLELASGEYIARMDADDISAHHRLAQQVAFLDAHPRISVLGAQIRILSENGVITSCPEAPLSPTLIRWAFLRDNVIAHSTVLARRKRLLAYGGYETEFAHAEDFALWTRMAVHDELANVPDVLLDYRWWAGSVSTKHRATQFENRIRIIQRYINQAFALNISLEDIHLMLAPRRTAQLAKLQPSAIERIVRVTLRLYDAFVMRMQPSHNDLNSLQKAVGEQLYPLVAIAIMKDPGSGAELWREVFRVSKDPTAILRKVHGKIRRFAGFRTKCI